MLVENVVAQMLAAAGRPLFFFSTSEEDNHSDRMEIDFLITKSNIGRRHNICPVEVKSSRRYDHTSLDKFLMKYKKFLGPAFVLHSKDIVEKNGITYLPLYMTPCL